MDFDGLFLCLGTSLPAALLVLCVVALTGCFVTAGVPLLTAMAREGRATHPLLAINLLFFLFSFFRFIFNVARSFLGNRARR